MRRASWLLLCFLACRQVEVRPDASRAVPTVDAPASAEGPHVIVHSNAGRAVRVFVELARTESELRRGLMYRQHLPPDAGMLFLFDKEEIQSFWMKNTYLPLDMIFIHEDLTVAGVVENALPMTLDARAVGSPSRYVLEVNAGWARAHHVQAGTRIEFVGVKQ